MNIFFLDKDPGLCAKYHCDRHLVQQINTVAQILSTVMRKSGIEYGFTAKNKEHPCVLWVEESDENFLWLHKLGMELCREFSFRYSGNGSHRHTCEHLIRDTHLESTGKNLQRKRRKKFKITNPPQLISDHFKSDEVVKSYRDYYLVEKTKLLVYTKRQVPDWVSEMALGEHR